MKNPVILEPCRLILSDAPFSLSVMDKTRLALNLLLESKSVFLCRGTGCAPWCSSEFPIWAVFSQRNTSWKGQHESSSSVRAFVQLPSSTPTLMNYKWPFIAATSAGRLLLWPSSHPWAPSLPLIHQLFPFVPRHPRASSPAQLALADSLVAHHSPRQRINSVDSVWETSHLPANLIVSVRHALFPLWLLCPVSLLHQSGNTTGVMSSRCCAERARL